MRSLLHAWERDVTDERAGEAAMLEAEKAFGELCERLGIIRQQGSNWKERYDFPGHLCDRNGASTIDRTQKRALRALATSLIAP